MQPGAAFEPVSAAETEAHIEYIRRALGASDDSERIEALTDQILTFGHRAIVVWTQLVDMASGRQKAQFNKLRDRVISLHTEWMRGRSLSSRPDEDERRALDGLAILRENAGVPQLHHYPAQAIMALPEGHKLRDVALVRSVIREEIEWLQKNPADERQRLFALAGALSVAFDEQFGTQEELLSWESLAAQAAPQIPAATAMRMWRSVEDYYLALAAGDPSRWMPETDRVRGYIDALPLTRAMKAKLYLSDARRYIEEKGQRTVAELYKRALDTKALTDVVDRLVATKEARVRSGHGEYKRAVQLMRERLEAYEEDYLTAITASDRSEAGKEYAECTQILAFAYALQDRWPEAVEAIERGKCLRQRYTLALRRTPEAARLLDIEGELYALSRGLPADQPVVPRERVQDWLSQGLSPEVELQERYRRVLPKVLQDVPRAIRLRDIADALREDEAALSLGLSWQGTMAVLIGKRKRPVLWTCMHGDVPQKAVVQWLAWGDTGADGLLLRLEAGMAQADPRPALERALHELDDLIGKPVAAVMQERGLKQLVVLPHDFLRLAPLWALESWRDLDVRILPGAFALLNRATPSIGPRALVVANPTGDLPLADTEASVSLARLSAAGLETQVLRGAGATEHAIGDALKNCNLLHFAGHGIASLENGSMSALLVSPVWTDTPVRDAAAMARLAERAEEFPQVTVDADEGSPRKKVFFEYAKRGTLYAELGGDQVLVAGELWRAGDILIQGSFERCGLAFLCACSSGLGAVEDLQEATGLPAALQIAGVGTVVSTGWPVADEIACLFADEFYRRALPDHREGRIDVVAAVRQASAALRTMTREDAQERVAKLADNAPDARARFRLKVFAKRVAAGPERPFEHPFHSSAFFVTGAAEVNVEAPRR